MTLLIVSFLMWSLGICMSLIIITIYFWRLTRHHLPVREAIVSCFIPVGPCGMGAFAIQNLAVVLSNYIRTQHFILHRDVPTPVDPIFFAAVSECINWIGVIIALCLIGLGTFFLTQATAAVIVVMPKRFNVGFWAFVFPVGVYANGVCQLANDLDNAGFRGWAAFCVALTLVLWLGCALGTLYKAVWCGELFFAPGLEGWNEKKMLEQLGGQGLATIDVVVGDGGVGNGRHDEEAERYHVFGEFLVKRLGRPDGTYGLHKAKQKETRVEAV